MQFQLTLAALLPALASAAVVNLDGRQALNPDAVTTDSLGFTTTKSNSLLTATYSTNTYSTATAVTTSDAAEYTSDVIPTDCGVYDGYVTDTKSGAKPCPVFTEVSQIGTARDPAPTDCTVADGSTSCGVITETTPASDNSTPSGAANSTTPSGTTNSNIPSGTAIAANAKSTGAGVKDHAPVAFMLGIGGLLTVAML